MKFLISLAIFVAVFVPVRYGIRAIREYFNRRNGK